MATQLLQCPLRTRGQVARIRFQAKRIARLLGFPLLEQMEFACRAFELALEAAQARPRRALTFNLDHDRVSICFAAAETEPAPALVVPLPKAPEFAVEDVRWLAQQLSGLLQVDVLDVVREQNEEIQRLSQALKCCRSDLERLGQDATKHSAA
ncbi:MAG: hypothetical protein U0793_06860 [Gemmataceae bacterium]